MKKKHINIIFGLSLLAASFTACNDYDTTAIDYEAPEIDEEVEPTPPSVDPSWGLKVVSNNGQFDKRVFVYEDKLYNAMFSTTAGWTGGDIVFSYRMPDNRVVWGARDSFFGVVDAETRARQANANTVRTTLLIQSGDINSPKPGDLFALNELVQTDDPTAKTYYNGVELMPSSKTNRRYYPLLANYSNGQMHVLYGYYGTTPTAPRYSTALVDYTLTGNPGDEGYMRADKTNTELNSNTLTFEHSQLVNNDGYTYMYASNVLNSNSQILVSRIANDDYNSQPEYWVLNTDGKFEWVTEMPDSKLAAPRSNVLADNGSCQNPQAIKSGDYYYIIGQQYKDGNTVYIWRSKTPYGPFAEQKTLFVVPASVDKLGNRNYSALTRVVLHQGLSRQGELVFSTSQTAAANADNFTYPGSADYVRPYFYRIYNWESIYEE